MSRDKLKVEGGRRRASGVNKHERRFATVRTPDGREARVPAAKDACTYICIATPHGGWPERAAISLMYDVTHLVEQTVFTVKEMRPGHGMGTMRTLQVLKSEVVIEHHEGTYGQIQRWLLCEEIESNDDIAHMTVADLQKGLD